MIENTFAKCKKENFINYIDTNKGCIAMDPYKKPDKNKKKLIVLKKSF